MEANFPLLYHWRLERKHLHPHEDGLTGLGHDPEKKDRLKRGVDTD